MILKNCKAFVNKKLIETNIIVEKGKIKKITKERTNGNAFNCKGKILLPGIIDAHVHFRDFEEKYKEDWRSGPRAAAKGGVTTVIDMPNNKPPIINEKRLSEKRKIATKSIIDYGFYVAIGDFKDIKDIAGVKVFLGQTTGNIINDDENFIRTLEYAKGKKWLVTIHAEDQALLQYYGKKYPKKAVNHNKLRPPICAKTAVEKVVNYVKALDARANIAHVTTGRELEAIKNAKKNKVKITCSVTPHHLFLNENATKELGNFAKVNPPLRSKKDVEKLWDGIYNKTVDMVVSDHAPHTIEEKNREYSKAPSGIPGVELSLPLMLNALNKKRIALRRIAELMSENPAKILGIKNKGAIEKGRDADFVLVDLKKEKRVKNEELETKVKWSPFEGRRLKGWPIATWVRGNMVWDGENTIENKGKEVKFLHF